MASVNMASMHFSCSSWEWRRGSPRAGRLPRTPTPSHKGEGLFWGATGMKKRPDGDLPQAQF
jgi:hypothetical protein